MYQTQGGGQRDIELMEFFTWEILTELMFSTDYNVWLFNNSHGGVRKFHNSEFSLLHQPAFTPFHTSDLLP